MPRTRLLLRARSRALALKALSLSSEGKLLSSTEVNGHVSKRQCQFYFLFL